MAQKFTRAFWGQTRGGFTPSPGGLRSWYSNYGRSFPDLQLVDTGEEPYLKVGDALIDVIAGPSGNTRWGWKTVGEPESKSAEDKARERQESKEQLQEEADRARETAEDVDQGDLYEGEFTPPTGGEAFTQAQESLCPDPRKGNEGRLLPCSDPVFRDPQYAKSEGAIRSAALNPPNSRWDEKSQTWITLSPGSKGYEETYGDYYESGDPCGWEKPNKEQRYQALKSTYKEQGWKTPENWPASLAECPEKPPEEECADGQDRVNGKCPPPPNGKCDDQPGTVWDEALGQCIYPPRPPTPGDPGPGYRTYGMDPNDPDQPWDVDLSYLKDAPPFEFEHDPWVEPEAFSYAPYEQPEGFSYPEFAPPTGQQLLEEDPGYQFRLDEGTRRLQARAAAGGLLRTGRTLKELMDYGQNAASEEYQKAYNRRLKEYQEGSGLAERAWDRNVGLGQWAHSTNLGSARDQWTLGRGAQLEGFGVNRQNAYKLARDQYSPQLASWSADQRARERAEFAKYGRQWQAYTYGQPSASTIYQTGAGYSTT
jgi:hypothetical protein